MIGAFEACTRLHAIVLGAGAALAAAYMWFIFRRAACQGYQGFGLRVQGWGTPRCVSGGGGMLPTGGSSSGALPAGGLRLRV